MLPIYVHGGGAPVTSGAKQAQAFHKLLETHADRVTQLIPGKNSASWQVPMADAPISLLVAIENASAFADNDEPLDTILRRLDALIDDVGPLAYVSLTWSHANRFGGGNTTDIGITDDGRALVEHLVRRGVAVDLSHASDPLMDDILSLAEAHPNLRLVASHANLRAVHNVKRNLPNHVARAIAERGGIIGLNIIRGHVGPLIDTLAEHVLHADRLGIADALCIGADFFHELDLPRPESRRLEYFFEGYGDASCYGALANVFREGGLSEACVRSVLQQNMLRWIKTMLTP